MVSLVMLWWWGAAEDVTVPLVLAPVGVLQVKVLGGGPCMGCLRWLWVWALATPGGRPGGRWSSFLAVLVASANGAAPGQSLLRVPLVSPIVRLVQATVLSMPVAW